MAFEHVCPICGTVFSTARRNAKYCSNECRYLGHMGRTLYEKTCHVCGERFVSTRQDAKYCSQKCTGVAKRGVPSPKKGMFGFVPTRMCVQCGKIFHAHTDTAKFCSVKCKNDARRGVSIGGGFVHKCLQCNLVFISGEAKSIYCSVECYYISKKGKKHTPESIKNMSGHTPWNKGTRGEYTDDYRAKISKNHKDVSGSNNPAWRGGISFEPYCKDFNGATKERIRDRDNRTCQLCYVAEGEEKLSVHHIHYDKENCNPDMISLCRACHSKVHANRDYYEALFMGKLEEMGALT